MFSSSSSSLRSAPQTCCPSPKVKCQTLSGLRPSLTSTPPGAGAGMEAEEAARQCTAPAMILKSRAHTAACKLRRRGCCGSASSAALHGAHIIVPILTTTQSSHSWRPGPFGEISPWLAMLTGCLDQHNGRRSAYSSTNSWASSRSNLHERSVQLTLHERLRAFDLECRIHHAFDEEFMAAPSTYRAVQGL